ncbi:hypothetical protein QE250_16865, partial [Chromatiaceae bacterium AAb-1]|nr:hypothetical protein [Chromatiaceae bacterium AAb-1]
DPIIQNPGDSQSFNPYSYIMNNPLAGTDPTGYCAAETGSHLKSCGDMKVELKVDGVAVGSKVVKNVNFRNGADVNAGLSAGGAQIGQAIMDIGSQNKLSEAGAGGVALAGRMAATGTTAAGAANAGALGRMVNPLGALITGLLPTKMGDGTFSQEELQYMSDTAEHFKEAELSGIRHAEKQISKHRGNKVAVIGQGQQTRVIPYRDSVGGISFSIPARYVYESEYMSQFSSDIQEQISVAFNRGWINGVMNSGYQIHDIGMAKGRTLPGPWYGAELHEVARRRYPTTTVKFK